MKNTTIFLYFIIIFCLGLIIGKNHTQNSGLYIKNINDSTFVLNDYNKNDSLYLLFETDTTIILKK